MDLTNIVEIARQIELKKTAQRRQKKQLDWSPQKVEKYTVPSFKIPDTRNSANNKKQLSKVLAFIDMNKQRRYTDACTIMPIPTTNKRLISICGSPKGVSRLINFMEVIGLVELESDQYRYFDGRKDTGYSRTYRYYVENEHIIQRYCEENKIMMYRKRNYRETLVDTFVDIGSFDKSQVKFSSKLHLLKPTNWSKAEFEDYLTEILKQNYPQLGYYQLLADTINEQYYDPDYPDLMVRYVPNFKWSKGNKAVRKIGIRATNTNVSASSKGKEEAKENFCGKFKDDILKEYGFTMEKDVSSSVPRLTLSINTGCWIPETIDIYKLIWERYKAKKGSTNETLVDTFKTSREAVKSLHMRGYFDSPARLGVNTRNAMLHVADPDGVDREMALLREAIIEAEGYHLYDSEIFFHESNIYMEVLKQLLDEDFFVWQCYDCWYARKEGVSQEGFEAYVTELVEEKANNYIKHGIDAPVRH